MKPNKEKITIKDNIALIEKMLMDLVLTPRIKALEWSKITKQTPNMKIGYPGQHLASLVVGMVGAKTGARGNDITDGSEVKSCSRIDQLDTCNNCEEKVLRIEKVCSTCGSTDIARMNDSKWLFTIRSKDDLKVLSEDVDRVILTIADYPGFDEGNYENLRFQVFEIWTKSKRHQHFVTLMRNYYNKIYLTHKRKNPAKIPAPKNFWPYSYQFYLCNPIKVFSCVVKNANVKPEIIIEHYVPPEEDRSLIPSENMPIDILKKDELFLIAERIPDELLRPLLKRDYPIQQLRKEILEEEIEFAQIKEIIPFISEEARQILPLRDTDKIFVVKTPYSRKR